MQVNIKGTRKQGSQSVQYGVTWRGEKKNLLFVPLGKTFKEIPPSTF